MNGTKKVYIYEYNLLERENYREVLREVYGLIKGTAEAKSYEGKIIEELSRGYRKENAILLELERYLGSLEGEEILELVSAAAIEEFRVEGEIAIVAYLYGNLYILSTTPIDVLIEEIEEIEEVPEVEVDLESLFEEMKRYLPKLEERDLEVLTEKIYGERGDAGEALFALFLASLLLYMVLDAARDALSRISRNIFKELSSSLDPFYLELRSKQIFKSLSKISEGISIRNSIRDFSIKSRGLLATRTNIGVYLKVLQSIIAEGESSFYKLYVPPEESYNTIQLLIQQISSTISSTSLVRSEVRETIKEALEERSERMPTLILSALSAIVLAADGLLQLFSSLREPLSLMASFLSGARLAFAILKLLYDEVVEISVGKISKRGEEFQIYKIGSYKESVSKRYASFDERHKLVKLSAYAAIVFLAFLLGSLSSLSLLLSSYVLAVIGSFFSTSSHRPYMLLSFFLSSLLGLAMKPSIDPILASSLLGFILSLAMNAIRVRREFTIVYKYGEVKIGRKTKFFRRKKPL